MTLPPPRGAGWWTGVGRLWAIWRWVNNREGAADKTGAGWHGTIKGHRFPLEYDLCTIL